MSIWFIWVHRAIKNRNLKSHPLVPITVKRSLAVIDHRNRLNLEIGIELSLEYREFTLTIESRNKISIY